MVADIDGVKESASCAVAAASCSVEVAAEGFGYRRGARGTLENLLGEHSARVSADYFAEGSREQRTLREAGEAHVREFYQGDLRPGKRWNVDVVLHVAPVHSARAAA